MQRLIGLMSGTSLDGLDVALVRVEEGSGARPGWTLEAFISRPYPPERRARLLEAITAGTPPALARLHADLGEWFAEGVIDLLDGAAVDPRDVTAIGSHGQTIWHEPPAGGTRGVTLQLGDPATLAARTGIDVVADFRAADVAAGGEGAPLVPWPDHLLFSVPGRGRIVLNIGGIANLTWLPPGGDPAEVIAFDTGPGNVLIDHATVLASGGQDSFDAGGRRAAAGRVLPDVLRDLLADPFFDRPPPRSTGRERFGPARVEQLAARLGLEQPGDAGWNDLLATLAELTAVTLAEAIHRWVPVAGLHEVLIAGGGSHNRHLVARLGAALQARGIAAPLRTGAEALGVDPDAREAVAFAILAWAHLEGRSANLPQVTGAAGPRVLGSFTPAPRALDPAHGARRVAGGRGAAR